MISLFDSEEIFMKLNEHNIKLLYIQKLEVEDDLNPEKLKEIFIKMKIWMKSILKC